MKFNLRQGDLLTFHYSVWERDEQTREFLLHISGTKADCKPIVNLSYLRM